MEKTNNTTATENAPIKLESLFTQENSEKGVWQEFEAPGGVKFKLKLYGIDSFHYRASLLQQNAQEVAREPLKDDEYNSEAEVKRRHLLRCEQGAEMVADWEGFDVPFSKENCLKLFINAPQFLLEVDHFIANRLNFISPQ